MKFRKDSVSKRGIATTLDLTPVVDIVFNLLITHTERYTHTDRDRHTMIDSHTH